MSGGLLTIQKAGDRLFSRTPVTGSLLKWIALLCMVLDHIAAAGLVADPLTRLILRRIGRVAFPMFCFLAAEALEHGRNSLRYAGTLAVFALISEIPFDLCFKGQLTWGSANVLFTLGGAALVIALCRYGKGCREFPFVIAAGIGVLVLAEVLQFDYAASGILLIWLFYGLRKLGWLRIPASALYMLFVWDGIQMYALCALPLLLLYNGRKGGTRVSKYFFYAFYPTHLMVLYWIRCLW